MASPLLRRVFLTGGTGYLGSRLIPFLFERGHTVLALARPESASKLPTGCHVVTGNALDGRSFAERVREADTFVQLVGVAHPAPWKGAQFRAVDLASVRASVDAAKEAKISHCVYVSVAHPAPVMKAYIQVRTECESVIRASGLSATVLRPWYILGPGHWWPVMLRPAYWLCERLPKTRESAQRLGLVTARQMVRALLWAVEHPSDSFVVLDVPAIRQIGG